MDQKSNENLTSRSAYLSDLTRSIRNTSDYIVYYSEKTRLYHKLISVSLILHFKNDLNAISDAYKFCQLHAGMTYFGKFRKKWKNIFSCTKDRVTDLGVEGLVDYMSFVRSLVLALQLWGDLVSLWIVRYHQELLSNKIHFFQLGHEFQILRVQTSNPTGPEDGIN